MRLGTIGGIGLLLLACCSGTGPEVVDAAGSYQATTLRASVGGLQIDALAAGGSLNVTLHPNGTTTGRLFVPASATQGEELDEDLAGTWTQTGNTVQFSHPTDTFVRDAVWTVSAQSLRTIFTTGTTTVTVVLARQ
jgi:hypothetical protein